MRYVTFAISVLKMRIILEKPFVIPRFKLFVHGILRYLCIYLSSLQGYMPKKVFNHNKRNPCFKHMGGSSVPHGMWRVIMFEHFRILSFCLVNVLGVYFLNTGNGHLLMCLT